MAQTPDASQNLHGKQWRIPISYMQQTQIQIFHKELR